MDDVVDRPLTVEIEPMAERESIQMADNVRPGRNETFYVSDSRDIIAFAVVWQNTDSLVSPRIARWRARGRSM